MFIKRPADERGHADHGWLRTFHSFSFADYHDPRHMGFRALRVLNDDIIAPGRGFGTHGHRDMEIITYVLDGALEHKDSMGTGSVLRPGDVQRMTAGKGVTHSEFNHSATEPLRLLQIWVLPERPGLEPGYEERNFPAAGKRNRLQLIASPDGRDGSLTIHQDVRVFAGLLDQETALTVDLAPGRHLWLQMARGRVLAGDHPLEPGDGLAVSDESGLTITGVEPAEFLLFDLN